VYAKFCCIPLHIKKALGISGIWTLRELITTTRRTTKVALWDRLSGPKRKPTMQCFASFSNACKTVSSHATASSSMTNQNPTSTDTSSASTTCNRIHIGGTKILTQQYRVDFAEINHAL